MLSSLSLIPRPPSSTLFPYTTLFRSLRDGAVLGVQQIDDFETRGDVDPLRSRIALLGGTRIGEIAVCHGGELDDKITNAKEDRKSTRLNSSHVEISYAVFCLKKKKED